MPAELITGGGGLPSFIPSNLANTGDSGGGGNFGTSGGGIGGGGDFGCGSGGRQSMGISWDTTACWRKKHRWLMEIDQVSGIPSVGAVSVLPPQKSARPSLTFKEIEAQHLTETIYFPSKPDWKPISLVLYDVKTNGNPVFDWIKTIYDPENESRWLASCSGFKRKATLRLFDGCGVTLDTWVFENAWPQVAEFGDLDMSESAVVVCEVTLRYDRAYIVGGIGGGGNFGGKGGPNFIPSTIGGFIPPTPAPGIQPKLTLP